MATEAMVQVVTQVLNRMARLLANPKPVDAEAVDDWAMVLEAAGLSTAEVVRAAGVIVQTENFFPTPAKFIAIARPKADEDVSLECAWQRVREVLFRYGAYASLTSRDVGGGDVLYALSRVGLASLAAEMHDGNRAIYRAEFIRALQAARWQGRTLDYLPGLLERDNGTLVPDLAPHLCGRTDWRALPPERQRRFAPGGALALPAGGEPPDLPRVAHVLARLPALPGPEIQRKRPGEGAAFPAAQEGDPPCDDPGTSSPAPPASAMRAGAPPPPRRRGAG